MALKQIVLRARIDQLRAQRKPLEEAHDALAQRRTAWQTREAELEQAISEVTDATSEEDRALLDEQVNACVADGDTLTGEEQANADALSTLDEQITQAEEELRKVEENAAKAMEQQKPAQRSNEHREEREGNYMPNKLFYGMNHEQRDAFFKRDEVKTFLQRVRGLRDQQRGVTGGEILIPTVVMDVIYENITEASKLAKHVNLQRVPGKARQGILGVTPEAVWTEMCGKINEAALNMSVAEVDGYKVGAYVPVCNALLEDADDVNLGQVVITALINAIGLALDKAITHGTGTKMPLGIVTRLMQTDAPADAGEYDREWEDVSTSNTKVIASGTSGADLYSSIMLAAGAAKGKYSRGGKFWAMSESTRMTLMANLLSISASGALATGLNEPTMPIIGGAIETLDYLPDGLILGGYGDLYLLAERAGTTIAQSEHARFTDDQTLFRATARYDGLPVIAEAFVAISINGAAINAGDVTFAQDTANA